MNKFFQFLVRMALLLRPVCIFLVKLGAFFAGCGIYDVTRNTKMSRDLLRRYFLGNGLLTWILSPFNIILDLLALPYKNKGVYRLEDLPKPYQAEIKRLIEAAYQENLVAKLEERLKDLPRSMVFFKWYGANVDSFVEIPAFHEKYQYIQTIGVSVFNKKQSTTRHFGPFRATLRLLYNINDIEDNSAYIEVGKVKNYWRENKLFIFDDTLLHQSFNESDQVRYCLFVDILRPAAFTGPFASVVTLMRVILKGVNHIFYNKWDVIKN